MKNAVHLLFTVAYLTGYSVAPAQPHVYPLGLVVTDQVNADLLPAHMQDEHARLVESLGLEMQHVLADLGRFETHNWQASYQQDRLMLHGPQPVDYVIHAILGRSDRIYRNRILYQYQEDFLDFNIGNPGDGATYQVMAQPAISMQIRIKIIRQPDNKIIWSSIHDSTAVVPHNTRIFLFHPTKYPGLNHPELIERFMANIVRMRMNNRMVDNQLEVADFWFMSNPHDDISTAKELIKGLASSCFRDLDNNLPLAGTIQQRLPKKEEKSKGLFTLSIGRNDGVKPKLKMDVWRSAAQKQKVGKIEVISVDSTTSIARLRKLEKKIRKRGEGIRLGDLVISSKRRFNRKRLTP